MGRWVTEGVGGRRQGETTALRGEEGKRRLAKGREEQAPERHVASPWMTFVPVSLGPLSELVDTQPTLSSALSRFLVDEPRFTF